MYPKRVASVIHSLPMRTAAVIIRENLCSKTVYLWRAESLWSFPAKCATLELSVPLRLLSQGPIDWEMYCLALTLIRH
jgi:hypothetical protein